MTAHQSVLMLPLFFLLLFLACSTCWAAPLVPSSPVPVQDEDVELVEVDHTGKLAGSSATGKEEEEYQEKDQGDASAEAVDVLVIQSSMVTPFHISTAVVIGPGGSVLVPDEPNFFWSGSGDDPDAGMTYWITTTVTRTSLVTIRPSTTTTTSTTSTTSTTPTTTTTSTTTTTTRTTIRPTPPFSEEVPMISPEIPPQYWIRTVFRPPPGADESSPSFRRLVHSTLRHMYGQQQLNLIAGMSGGGGSGNNSSSSTQSSVQVMIQNITRRAADVHVLYALLVTSAIPIDPQMASAVLSGDDGQTTRDLSTVCPYDASQADVMRLCQSVVTRAEPFMARSEAKGAAVASSSAAPSWILIGSVFGGVLVLIVLVIIVVFILSRNKRKKQKERTNSPSAPSLPVPSALLLEQQRKKAVRSQGTATVEEDPDPWVRKARSTSKKHGREVGRYGGSSRRNSSRPVTAPARPLVLRRPSTSSLSAVAYSGSSSASSPVIDRLDYRLSREEPVQHSRGARRLKKRHKNQPPSSIISDQPGPSSRTKKKKSSRKSKDPQPDVIRSGAAGPESSVAGTERPIPKPRTIHATKPTNTFAPETETQEISADFTACPEDDDEEEDEGETGGDTSEVLGWGPPGSLIPSRVTGAIFGCRKVSSAPAAGHHQSDVHPAKATRGWVSADQLPAEKSIASRHAEGDDASRRTCSNNNNSSAAPPEVTGTSSEAPKSNKRHPPLHVHSNSFPAWPSLSEADPAIDLINTIKAELKKFEHR